MMSPIDPDSILPPDPRSLIPNVPNLNSVLEGLQEAQAAKEARTHGHANVIFERLKECVEESQSKLKPNQEIGAYLASFGPQTEISIETIAYRDPFLIVFNGIDQNKKLGGHRVAS